jgi:hypothetical protein
LGLVVSICYDAGRSEVSQMIRSGAAWLVAMGLAMSCGGAVQPTADQPDQPEQPEEPAAPDPPLIPPPDPLPPEPVPQPSFVQPEVNAGEDGWEIYVGETAVTRGAAELMTPGTVSPEAAVMHFYASLIRGDQRYEEVLVPERSKKLEQKLARVLGWTFHEVRLKRRKASGEGEMWIKVYYDLEIGGERESGTDDVGVERIDGQWYVSSVPT